MIWDRRLYFPSEGRRAEDFVALKNPTASAGFEPTNLGAKGQHATSRPPKPLDFQLHHPISFTVHMHSYYSMASRSCQQNGAMMQIPGHFWKSQYTVCVLHCIAQYTHFPADGSDEVNQSQACISTSSLITY